MSDCYEQHVQFLLTLLRKQRWPLRTGLLSYKRDTPADKDLHQACLVLEDQGLIRRMEETATQTSWMPVES